MVRDSRFKRLRGTSPDVVAYGGGEGCITSLYSLVMVVVDGVGVGV